MHLFFICLALAPYKFMHTAFVAATVVLPRAVASALHFEEQYLQVVR
jgi:hypothetical protein